MKGHSPESAEEIEKQEFLLPQNVLNYATEYQQSVHVEENVPESPVHKHVGDNLPPVEIPRSRIEESESLDHVFLVDQTGQKHKAVDDYEVLCDSRDIGHETSPAAVSVVVSHLLKKFIDVPDLDDIDYAASVRGQFRVLTCKKRVNQSLRL